MPSLSWLEAHVELPDDVLLTIHDATFTIRGSTSRELQRAMQRSALYRRTGFYGYTTWSVAWTYRYREAGGRCAVTTWTVVEGIMVETPRWSPPAVVSAALRTRWDRFTRALLRHERGHVQIGLDGAGDIASYFQDQPSAPSCAELERDIDAWTTTALKGIRTDSRRYDVQTRHGATQGAVWPQARR